MKKDNKYKIDEALFKKNLIIVQNELDRTRTYLIEKAIKDFDTLDENK